MRLLNAKTLELEESWDNGRKYAILSHRWSNSEISFQTLSQSAIANDSLGFTKIQMTCRQAVHDNFDYVWIDACCINKDSSSELSEAINSMYRWYQEAEACYIHLADVSSKDHGYAAIQQQIRLSDWFTRGWTLQELLACRTAVFFDKEWEFLGTKQTLNDLLVDLTGINASILAGGSLSDCSVALKMSWAADRKTTRPEDIAYCLLGIFDVNMPLLYGEGNKAFLRLQEEIIKKSDDHSIFAWAIQQGNQPGLLADSPAPFKGCQAMCPASSRKYRSSYSMTNRGLSIKLIATPYTVDTFLARLDCIDTSSYSANDPHRVGVLMRRLDEDDQYARVQHNGSTFVWMAEEGWEPTPLAIVLGSKGMIQQIEMNVRQSIPTPQMSWLDERVNGFHVEAEELFEEGNKGVQTKFKVIDALWNSKDCILHARPQPSSGIIGTLDFNELGYKVKVIRVGFDFDFNPIVFVADSSGINYRTKLRDRNGQLNFELDRQPAQWSEEEQAQFPGIFERSAFDRVAWSKVGGNGIASDLKQHPGLWAIKGDRIQGLHVSVGDLADIRIERGHYQGKFIWNLSLKSLKKSSRSIRSLVAYPKR